MVYGIEYVVYSMAPKRLEHTFRALDMALIRFNKVLTWNYKVG